jgi:hypothetical protein
VEEVLSLKKEEGDPVLVEEEGWKEGSWVPSLSAFTPLDSFMGRGRMGGEEEVGESIRREMYSQKRIGDRPLTIVGRRRVTIRGEEIRMEMVGGGANETQK